MDTPRRYDDLDREALVALLERRDARQAYGLVWKREGISPDAAVNDDFVALDIDVSLSSATSDAEGWRNLVIEGDNWDALRALRLTCMGRVKTILIDPPYNTGNQDFVFNDRFVGPQDRYRQSIQSHGESYNSTWSASKQTIAEDGRLDTVGLGPVAHVAAPQT